MKERCLHMYEDILDRLETEPDLLGRIISGDDSGIYASAFSWWVRKRRCRRKQDSRNPKLNTCWSRSSMCVYCPHRDLAIGPDDQIACPQRSCGVCEKKRESWQDILWLLYHDKASWASDSFLPRGTSTCRRKTPFSPNLVLYDFSFSTQLWTIPGGSCNDYI